MLATLEELRPKLEIAVKSGALPVVLGGDDSIVLAAIAGARRYFRNVSLIYMDRDAGLNVPATTPSGCVDGMVISHISAAALRNWCASGASLRWFASRRWRCLASSAWTKPRGSSWPVLLLRRYTGRRRAKNGRDAGRGTGARARSRSAHEFVLQLDLDVIAEEDFPATNLPGPGGLRLAEVRQALAVWARHPNLAALVIAAYNPALDADGSAAKQLIELLVEILSPRLAPASTSATATEAPSAVKPAAAASTGAPTSADLPGGGASSPSVESENPPAAAEAAQSPVHSDEGDSSVQSAEPRSDSEVSSQ